MGAEELATLIEWRDRMFTLDFIGTYPNGIGYGNISQKQTETSFVISGTQTGHLAHTSSSHYTVVDNWDIEQNSLHCIGPVKASSESLTHAALYEYSPEIQAIIHIHHSALWRTYQYVLPTTDATVPYGTPEMAHEMWRLMEASDLPQQKILIMAGHEDGIIAFGETLAEVGDRLHRLLPN
ncbi:class II aldolase/adducin family protein [Leptolyngbya sp. FACHB-16]|nr:MULTISPECIES: class II aldolase/adducin family protein [unclassified Leptolyngbya]MBD1913798.1 class II aldolase/adducin family protein [Leptolyngbya sp. FACHB-8]MBD2153614.1 class II aldolase/adducin family protein [Leptolyngbya sp. FACHB-16]